MFHRVVLITILAILTIPYIPSSFAIVRPESGQYVEPGTREIYSYSAATSTVTPTGVLVDVGTLTWCAKDIWAQSARLRSWDNCGDCTYTPTNNWTISPASPDVAGGAVCSHIHTERSQITYRGDLRLLNTVQGASLDFYRARLDIVYSTPSSYTDPRTVIDDACGSANATAVGSATNWVVFQCNSLGVVANPLTLTVAPVGATNYCARYSVYDNDGNADHDYAFNHTGTIWQSVACSYSLPL